MIDELIADYKTLCMDVTGLIDRTGYKVDFVRERLKMSKAGFYHKRKKGNFSPDELLTIVKLIRLDEMEDEIFAGLIDKHKDDELLSAKETKKLILG